MAYVALSRFLFRAPLLPMRALAEPRRHLSAHPLGAAALALASPALAAALVRAPRAAAAAAAIDRYARRAAFRPTPHGLWAGVGVGRTAARTLVRTGTPLARLAPSWARLAALGRGLLEQPELRAHVRLRCAPSLILDARTMTWLGPGEGDGFCEERTADLDETVEAVVRGCEAWTGWSEVRAIADGDEDGDGDEIDEWMLTLIDGGVLVADTVPPLVGPPSEEWMAARLSRLPGVEGIAAELEAARAALRAGELAAAAAAMERLPGAASGQGTGGVHGTLLFPAVSNEVTLSRKAVARAAALAPLLFRLQEALAPPTAERTPGPALAESLDAATEIFGAGALDLAALARGEYGASPAGEDDEPDSPEVDGRAGVAVVAFLSNRIVAAARAGQNELALRSEELEPLLPDAMPPVTCELFLTPGRPRPRTPPGEGWLLGLHAPAGASWGRFAGALADDEEGRLLFTELKEGERRARPDETALDVVFAPHARVADLCGHPPLRDAALALTGWPAEGHPALTVSDLELVADPAALEPLALRRNISREPSEGSRTLPPRLRSAEPSEVNATSREPSEGSRTLPPRLRSAEPSEVNATSREPSEGSRTLPPRLRSAEPSEVNVTDVVTPAPLHRVRSTTAPRGIWRLLVGWSLRRQHAPWALAWGPLGQLDWTPRVRLDDFVIAPASWRLPPGAAATARRLTAWRRAHRVPRHVQVGHEDELLPVDLASPGAPKLLAGHERVHELWPPLGDTPDRAGRRIEAVIGLVDEPDQEARAFAAASAAATRAAGAVPSPARGSTGAPDWVTFKLFGAAERQDLVLAEVVAPLIAQARHAGWLRGWFFQRYVEGPGRRPHLRLRAVGDTDALAHALEARLAEPRRAGDVVAVERGPYFPEAARFGGAAALPSVHALFQGASELALAALTDGEGPHQSGHESLATEEDPRLLLLIGAHDALARAAGLDAARRRALAQQRRIAHATDVDEDFSRALAAGFRRARPALRAVLGSEGGGPLAGLLAGFERAATAALAGLDSQGRARLLPTLLHLDAVRLLGPDRDAEIRAYTYWERTLESLERHPASP